MVSLFARARDATQRSDRITVQLVPVQVFGARITLATTIVCAFEFAIGGSPATASAALGGLFVGLDHHV